MKNFLTIILFLFSVVIFAQSDNCATATIINLDANGYACVNGTTVNATSDNTMYGACNAAPVNEVWYTFVAQGPANTWTVTPQGMTDAEIVVYSGGCGNVLEICNTATGTNVLNANWGLTPGTQYWVGVMSNGGTEGGFELCVNSVVPPPTGGNGCAGAIPVCEGTTVIDMNTTSASGAFPSCFLGAVNNDAWFQFTVLQSGTFEWQATPTGASTGVELDWALFDITGGCPGVEIDCNYNYDFGGNNPAGQTPGGTGEFNPPSNLTAGNTYAIVVDFFSSGATGTMDFTVMGGTAVIAPLADFTITPTTPTCGASVNVTITDNSIGVPTWDFGDGSAPFVGNNPPAHNYTTPGTYAITATIIDATSGCFSTHTEYVQLFAPLAVTTDTTSEVCAGDCTGSITSTVTGGSGVYTYAWLPGGETTNSIINQCANNYTLTVTDAVCGNAVANPTLLAAPPCCNMDSILLSQGYCINNQFSVSTDVYFTGAPTTGTLTISIDDGTTTYDTIINAPFTSPTTWATTIPTGGGAFTSTATFSDDAVCTISIGGTAPPNCDCSADIGTFTVDVGGTIVTNDVQLCFGETFTMTSNGDYVAPGEATSPPGPPYNPSIGYMIFSCPPTLGLVPSLDTNDVPEKDPCYLGVIPAVFGGFSNSYTETNNFGQPMWAGGFPNDSTVYYVPITFYETTFGVYSYTNTDMPCYSMGTPVAVQYLPEVLSSNPVENCQDSSFTITITGGAPEIDGSNYVVSNLSPANAFFIDSIATHNGTLQIGGLLNGDMYSFDVADTNGCPITVSGGPFVGLPAADAGVDDTTCVFTYNLNATLSLGTSTGSWTGQAGVAFAPANSPNAVATASAPGVYELYWTEDNTNGCTDVDTVVISFSNLSYTTTLVQPTCGNANGTITVNAIDGLTPYQYSNDSALTFQALDSFPNLAQGSYDVVVVDALGCTQSSDEILIDLNSPVIDSLVLTDPLCNGDLNGSVVVYATGGTGVLQYSIDGGALQASSTFNGLAGATTYQFVAEDANGCSVSKDTILVDPVLLVLDSAIGTDVVCNGDDNGTINLYAQGGTGVLEYSIDNDTTYVSTSSFTNLAPATYMVWVRDENGCTDSTQVLIKEPVVISIPNIVDSVICFGESNGQIVVSPLGGVLPYSYSWTSSLATDSIETGLAAGNVTVTVTDANLCTLDSTFTVFESAQFTYTTDSLNSNCNQPDGWAAVVGFAGGTGTYTYDWGAGPTTNDTLFNLIPGNYDVIVSDENSCDTTITITVGNNPSVVLDSLSLTQPLCNGDANGEVVVHATGGAAPYQFSVNLGVLQPDSLFTGLTGATSYLFTVEDAVGCTDTMSIVLIDPVLLVLDSAIGTDVVCNGDDNGTINLYAQGGTGVLEYSIDNDTTYVTTSSFTSLAPATYMVWVRDENGCTDSTQVVIYEPLALSIPNVIVDVTCFGGNNGQAVAAPQGGISPYQYLWSTGDTTAVTNNLTATLTPADSVIITITDANNCTLDSTFAINQPAQFTYTTDSLNSNCNLPDGWAAVIGFAGGTGAYTYDWGAGPTNNDTLFNLIPGDYDVIVSDGNSCDTTITITVGNNPMFITSITDVVNVKCKDGADGAATANGSDPLVNYTFEWSTVPMQTDSTATGLQAGVWYYVKVTDPNTTCFEMDSVLLTEPDSVTIIATGTQTICAEQSADLSVTAQGGSGGYTYTWDNGLGVGQNQSVSPAPNSTTTYSVYATDDSLCTSAPATVTVTVLQELTVVASPTDTICPYESTVLSADPYFGNLGPYSYSWSPSAGLNNDTLQSPVANPSQPTMYYVTLSDGCSPDAVDSVYIGVWPLPNPLATVDILELCEQPLLPFTFDNATSLANGMLDTTKVTWHFGDGTPSILGDTITWDSIQHTYTAPGTYTVSMTAYTTPAQGGCYDTQDVVTVIVNPLPNPDFTSNPNPTTMFEPEVDFLDNTLDGNIWVYSWDFAGLGESPFPNPSFEFPIDTVGEYPVTLTVTDNKGCVNSITKIVIVNGEFGLFVPNTFTPDFDNKNDIFMAKGFGIAKDDFTMLIFDRWGEKIFEAHDIDQGWDGFYKGTRVKTDTYVWKIIFKDVNGEKHTKHGHVNIIQ